MKNQYAFTLFEILTVLALLAIIGRIAVPALQDFLERNQQQAIFNQIVRAVHNARSHAVTQRVTVELCGSRDGLSCHSDWSHGWLLREVKNDTPIAVTLLSPDRQHLQWKGVKPEIQFNSNGISSLGNGRFYGCYKEKISWQLILNRQGRLRVGSQQENSAHNANCS